MEDEPDTYPKITDALHDLGRWLHVANVQARSEPERTNLQNALSELRHVREDIRQAQNARPVHVQGPEDPDPDSDYQDELAD